MPAPSPSPLPTSALLERLPDILIDCANPHADLEQIAADHGTNLNALTLLLATTPAALDCVNNFELAAAVKIRAAALTHLPIAVAALSTMLSDYDYESRKMTLPRTVPCLELIETQRSNARRAAHLLLRLGNFSPRPLRPNSPHAPSGLPKPLPEGGVVGGSDLPSTPSAPPTSVPAPAPIQASGTDILPVSTSATTQSLAPRTTDTPTPTAHDESRGRGDVSPSTPAQPASPDPALLSGGRRGHAPCTRALPHPRAAPA